MKVLFVSRERKGTTSPIIHSQAVSLQKIGVTVDHYLIRGKGMPSYFFSIPKLRSIYKSYDVIHVHFSYSAIPIVFLKCRNKVISFMGSDLNKSKLDLLFSRILSKTFRQSIVKSKKMYDLLNNSKAHIMPNGVDVDTFMPGDLLTAKRELGWDIKKRHVLFAANPDRPEKNFDLAKKAFQMISSDRGDLDLKVLKDVPFEKMAQYYNASDVVILTSHYEGSPNVIKEAMSCNKPIVCVNVGDVEKYTDIPGFFLTDHEPENVGTSILNALNVEIIETRKYIVSSLSHEKIAQELSQIYQTI